MEKWRRWRPCHDGFQRNLELSVTSATLGRPPIVAAPSAATECNSTVEAARRRVRGPTLTEKRLREAADAEKAEE